METEQHNGNIRRTRRKKEKKYVLTKLGKRLFLGIIIPCTLFALCSLGIFLTFRLGYAPKIQEYLVTSSMTTLNHKWIAHIVADPEQIKIIMDRNRIDENYPKQNTALIVASSAKLAVKPVIVDKSKIEPQVKEQVTKTSDIDFIDIDRDGYKGYLLKIADPKRVFISTANALGTHGMKIASFIKKYDAFAGINAGGFTDTSGHGNGGSATGIVIANGKIKYRDETLSNYNIVGLNKNNVLVLGKYTLSEVQQLNLRDAIDFHPFLVINGVRTKVYGNGGWGSGPRSAIGQKADGTILLLVVDGRQISSLGASMKQMQDLMVENGAINAANLDGGSSTVMYYHNSIVNHPCSPYGDRFLPTAFLVSK